MPDDFFSNVPRRPSGSDNEPAHGDFAHAISVRFGSADLRTARLLPDDHPSRPSPPSPALPPPLPPPPPHPPSPSHVFIAVPPSALASYLTDPRALVLDIRPHAAHAAARINSALSLSVPTTLLKRPLFSLSKLSQMLPSPSSRARFADWSSASRILVYDSDSTFSPDNSIITGLLRKFRAEGFAGELGWVRGGFQAVWKEVRHLATTEPPSPEEDDPDAASLPGTLRTTHLPRAAFSLCSTTAAPPHQLVTVPGPNSFSYTLAPPAPRAANPFFDTIRQNVELSHGITERIPLRLPRRVRRRIADLPSRWLQDIARRSAVRHSSTSRHPGLDSLESGSESSDDPHTSDPDENDPNVEEGAEALAMQFYRIELAEQRRLRSIMEHHTRESQVSASAKSRRVLGKDGGGVSVRTGAMSVPGTPAAFPFSITAAVEKGTKNRYTHIWPFEHARVRLHDGRHRGSHTGRRDKGKASERGRSTRDQSGGKARERAEQELEQDKQTPNHSSPAAGTAQDQEATQVVSTSSRHSFHFDERSLISGTSVEFEAGPAHPILAPSPSVPRVKIEYDTTEQDSRTLGPPTPATALPFPTPPFYTPMETLPASTPMRLRSPQLLPLPSSFCVTSGAKPEETQVTPSTPSVSHAGLLPSFPLRLPHCPGGLPSIGEQTWADLLPSPVISLGAFTGRVDPRREPSPADDYVNASYVQPLCTRKRYIATQGPLPSTYVDFWTLVWEQNVHVIVMLTREVENAMVKCGSYWTDAEYGPLRLELLSASPPPSPSASAATTDISMQGFFTIREPKRKTSGASSGQPTLITRRFLLSHTSYPGVPPRRITHLQYLDWSDMNVPDDPQGVLDLVKKVEQAAAESTPGPSPSGSLSPGSGSGSPSSSQSPHVGPDQKVYDTSLLSPTSAGVMPRGGRGSRRSEWRHPELDLKSGIAAFALGKAPPVLLHCSAGVGRTGGFIAVDAVLDGIKRELRKSRAERRLKKASRVGIAVSPACKIGANDVEASGESDIKNRKTAVNNMESCDKEGVSESERMDVDEPTIDEAEKNRFPLQMINTVPIHVSAGDHTKSRRRHNHGNDCAGEKPGSESLVVHVPYAGTDDVPEGNNVTGIDLGNPKEADWQSSTREWIEKVSDQTHTHVEQGSLPPPSLLPPSSRERSPGSTSSSSDPSALNSTDSSMSGSASAGTRSGIGSRAERNSDTGSASGSGTGSASASGRLLPSLVSKPGSESLSLSTSGSGTGTGSRFGSSLLHALLRDSSVTSVSLESTDSLSPRHESKSNVQFHRPSAIHAISSDMEVDCPPRSVSAPLQISTTSLRHGVHSYHHKPMHGLSPIACFSSPVPPGTAERDIAHFDSDAAEGPTSSRPSSDPGSDELTTPSAEFESGESAGAEGNGKDNQQVPEKLEEPAILSEQGTNPQLNVEPNAPDTLHSDNAAKNPHPSFKQTRGKERAISLPSRALDDLVLPQLPASSGVLGTPEPDWHAEHPVIDYKLPRELHIDFPPPLISSFAEPICAIIQDMREQRMSLCQSLRQYVFVHAAIIEGALRIVDEERELWGYSGTSDDTSSAEGEPIVSVGRGIGESGMKAQFGGVEVVATKPELGHGSIPRRTRLLHAMTQLSDPWSSEGNNWSSDVPMGPVSSSSSVPSPSKGKRAPSPTELLREDKTGALSLNKRPSIQRRRMSNEDDQFSFDSRTSSPVAGENGGRLRDAVVGVGATRSALGRLVIPEKGDFMSSNAR